MMYDLASLNTIISAAATRLYTRKRICTYSCVQNSIENFVLSNKMPMFQRAGMREGGFPLPPAF